MEQQFVTSDGTTGTEQYEIEITMVPGENLFYGEVTSLFPEPGRFFSGVVKGRKVYFTHWDGVTKGKLIGKNKIRYVNQAWSADEKSSSTAVGVAIRGGCSE